MTATGQSWLLIIAAIAAVVIFWGRASSILNWALATFQGGNKDPLPEEMQLIVNMVKAAKLITDQEQKQKVLDACQACFTGWVNAQVPPIPPPPT